MRILMETMAQALSQGTDLVFVTVTAATGATPRGAGARMLVSHSGRLCGTIGGGAVEYRAIEMARSVLAEKNSRQHGFSLTRNDVEDLGMICGGAVEVFFHYLPASDSQNLFLAQNARELLEQGEDLWLLSDLSAGGSLSLLRRENCPAPLLPFLNRKAKRFTLNGRELFLEQIGFTGKVYIFGGGHVAQELVPVLTHVGFRCVVMDDRPEFTDPALFPAADQVLQVDFTKIDEFITFSKEDYVCVMTRGHAYDTLIQAQLLQHELSYIGVIGSASKAAGVRKALIEEHGLSDRDADRITTPIGLKIEAETPAEIAISIAAQLIMHRAEQK